MYKIPVMVYLDQNSIEAIALDHNGEKLLPESENYKKDKQLLKKGNKNMLHSDQKPEKNEKISNNRTAFIRTSQTTEAVTPSKYDQVENLQRNNNYGNAYEIKSDSNTSSGMSRPSDSNTSSGINITNRLSDKERRVQLPILDYKSIAEQFIGSIFNDVNELLFPYAVQLQMVIQQPLYSRIDCSLANPLNNFLKFLENNHKDSTPYSKMFIIFCRNYRPYLELEKGTYISQKGKDFCINHLGFIFVNNLILREKIKRGLFSIISQSKINSNINKSFLNKICQYLNRCVDNKLEPVGMVTDFLKQIIHKGPSHMEYDPKAVDGQFTLPNYNEQAYNNGQVYNDQIYNNGQAYNDQIYNNDPYNGQTYNNGYYNNDPYNNDEYGPYETVQLPPYTTTVYSNEMVAPTEFSFYYDGVQ
ncbi:hypothetical protein M153_1576000413 [Pseudoloma neurophilia]|uniref:Uncharacterized protein n=1 Tax=Pseudoloma neurophilia TaxID=146866 RepID=A0A0R0M225_9MICR|nr:hypothetical protein M153_1576000413 [Pseudoloma neurophilia]